MLVPHIDLIVSLFGTLFCSVLGLLGPPILEIIHYWPEREQIPRFCFKVLAKNVLIILLALFSAFFGTTATITEVIRIMHK